MIWIIFCPSIPPDVINRINAIRFSNDHDRTFSLWSHLGGFDSRKASSSIEAYSSDNSWAWIWDCMGIPKTPHVLMEALVGASFLPTSILVESWLLVADSALFVQISITDHIFRVCHKADSIWKLLNIVLDLHPPFKDFIKSNCLNTQPLANCPTPHNITFIFSLCCVWLRKNAWIFRMNNITLPTFLKNSRWAATE